MVTKLRHKCKMRDECSRQDIQIERLSKPGTQMKHMQRNMQICVVKFSGNVLKLLSGD